jgi:ABC-type lipoprotein release transport system permease subunit
MIGGVLVMSAIALVAGWLPTWRAARVEPVEVLREN